MEVIQRFRRAKWGLPKLCICDAARSCLEIHRANIEETIDDDTMNLEKHDNSSTPTPM